MKKLTAFVLALALCLSLCTVTAFAEAKKIGSSDVTWELTESDTKLIIGGTGAMPNFQSGNPPPWASNKDSITSVSISSGVTTIGNSAFDGCTALTNVIIPNGVTSIDSGAFAASGLESITIPANVTNIGSNAFDNCSSLAKVMVMKATTPLTTLGTNVFRNCDDDLKIYVPAGSVDAYKGADKWSSYENRIEAIPTIANIIATYENFPLTNDVDLYWKNDQGTTCYYFNNILFFRYTSNKSLQQSMTVSVAADGKNYTYSDGTVTYTFIMDDSGVLAAITVSGSTDIKYNGTYGAPPTKYTVTNGTTDMNGDIAIDKASAAEGETVTITVNPADGYQLKTLKYNDGTTDYDITTDANTGEYQFTMPGYAVTVTAVFEENSGTGGGNPNPGHGYSAPSSHLVTSDLKSVTKVTIDGKAVDSKYYTVSGGNIILSGEFMKTLANGKHTVKLYNGNVAATGTMTVSGNAAVVSAKTADAGIALYGVLSVSSLLGMGWVRKRKH